MTPLELRIAGCVPLYEFGLDAVLRVLTIEETEAIPTAAIPVGGTPRLLVNPAFVKANCHTEEDLAVLVLHELHHLLLGHTRLYPRVTLLHNLAFDAVINAMLARARPQPRWLALFRRLYAADRFPEQLLRPPEGFPGEPEWPTGTPAPVRRLLTDLYYNGAGTFQDAFELLLRELPFVEGIEGLLLGSHSEGELPRDAALAAAAHAIVSRWTPRDPRAGRSLGGALAVLHQPPAPKRSEPALLQALLASTRAGSRAVGRPEPSAEPAALAWPTRDRRAFALSASGAAPLLYAGTLPGRPRPSGRAPVAVYVDVSGSMAEHLPRVVAAIRLCRDRIAPTVYQFSTGVELVSLEQMIRGEVRTRYGTSGESAAEHIRSTRPRSAVLITDGYMDPLPPLLERACREACLQLVLTPHGHSSALGSAAARIHTMEPA